MIKKMMIKKMMIKKKMTIKEWVKNMTIQIRLIIEKKKKDITLARDNNSHNQDQETKSKPTFYDNVHCTIQ